MSRDVATMDDLAIEGCMLRVRVEGPDKGPALVLSHMLGTDLTLWDALVPELAKHFRVVRYDTRGHGGSGLGDVPVTLERLGRDVVAILDALGIERAHFCGLSMGGAVGLWLLAHAPARLERAVIAGSAAKLGEPAVWNARIAAALAEGMEQAVEPTIERWFSPAFVERAPEPVEAIRTLLRATAPAGYAACCGALRDMDLREAVRGIATPVLVLRGADDPTVTAVDAGDLLEAMPHATAADVAAKHCAVVEAGAAFAAAVVKFLTAKTAPRRASGRRPAARPSAARAKPSARRVGNRGGVAARRPVARTAPVSGKAVAKASATRKTAARAVPPAPSRRRAAAEPTRAAAPKTAPRKRSEVAPSKPAKARAPARAEPASGKAIPAAKSTPAAAKRAAPARAKPPTAAALRAARTKTVRTPGTKAASRATPSSGSRTVEPAAAKTKAVKAGAVKARSAPAKTAPAKTAPAKTTPAKSAAAKTTSVKTAKTGTAKAATAKTKTAAPKARSGKTPATKARAVKPAASRRAAPAAGPSRSPGRGSAGSGRRKR